MPGFAGFDRSDYPGDAVMAWLLANTNLVWCGYYLAPAPSHHDTSWMGTRAALAAAGWGFAPVYLGRQVTGPGTRDPNATNGPVDGADAAAKMASEGFPAGSAVYLDVENGPPLSPDQSNYINAWCGAVAAAGFQPGVYCSHLLAANVAAIYPAALIWAFKVSTTTAHPVAAPYGANPPAGSGYAGATIWQYDDESVIACAAAPGGTLQVDLDTASVADPSAPVGAAAATV